MIVCSACKGYNVYKVIRNPVNMVGGPAHEYECGDCKMTGQTQTVHSVNIIVCWSLKTGDCEDVWQPMESAQAATALYKQLMADPNVRTAHICMVAKSTDYDVHPCTV